MSDVVSGPLACNRRRLMHAAVNKNYPIYYLMIYTCTNIYFLFDRNPHLLITLLNSTTSLLLYSHINNLELLDRFFTFCSFVGPRHCILAMLILLYFFFAYFAGDTNLYSITDPVARTECIQNIMFTWECTCRTQNCSIQMASNFRQISGENPIGMSISSVARYFWSAAGSEKTKSSQPMDMRFLWEKFLRGKTFGFTLRGTASYENQYGRRCHLFSQLLRYNAMQSVGSKGFDAIVWRFHHIDRHWTVEWSDRLSYCSQYIWTKRFSQITQATFSTFPITFTIRRFRWIARKRWWRSHWWRREIGFSVWCKYR